MAYLICVRGSDDDNGSSPGNLPGSARVHLAEEEVDEDGERPQDQVIQPPDKGRDVRLFLPHDDGAK